MTESWNNPLAPDIMRVSDIYLLSNRRVSYPAKLSRFQWFFFASQKSLQFIAEMNFYVFFYEIVEKEAVPVLLVEDWVIADETCIEE